MLYDITVGAVVTFTVDAPDEATARRLAAHRCQAIARCDDNLVGGDAAYVTPDAATLAVSAVEEERDCIRCGSRLNALGRCSDATCPFSSYAQTDPRGWAGHPHASYHRAEKED